MKHLSMIGAAALLVNTALVPAAWADTIPPVTANAADADTLAAMQDQCDDLAAAHDLSNGDVWSGTVVPGAVSWVSGPTEVAGTRVVNEATIVGTGTFTPGVTYIQGDPFRIGGSVNMFGDQYATSGSWSDSTYNYHADFLSVYAHAFSCDIYHRVFHAGDPTAGHYVIEDDYHGADEEAVRANCPHFTDHSQTWWGFSHAHCQFVSDATEDTLDPPVLNGNEAGIPVNQDQTDNLYAFEDHGGPVQASGGPFHIGQVVICISPSTTTKKGVPGAWVAKNGYDGSKCTTDWMANHAVWGSGTENSNGTYISVPDYDLYNL